MYNVIVFHKKNSTITLFLIFHFLSNLICILQIYIIYYMWNILFIYFREIVFD